MYGEFISEIVNNSVNDIVLKLIKPKNLSPEMKDAWKLKLKNMYKIPIIEEIDGVEDLELDIYLQNEDGSFANEIYNVKLLELFGMDNIDKKGTDNPDGKFDLVPGIIINVKTSEIIFPNLEPFGRNLPQELNDSLKIRELYNSTKNSVKSRMNFIIKGSYKYE